MTKKDYIIISSVIKEVASGWNYDSKYAHAVSTIAVQLSEKLKEENARFDTKRFLNACSVD